MTESQLWGLGAFAALLLTLCLAMVQSPRRMDGRQKYRRNRRAGSDVDPDGNAHGGRPSTIASPLAFLGSLLIGFRSGENQTDVPDGASELDGGDLGGDSGGGDGGGD